ncbi:MAG TPA: SDR family NAD(P)-dependent oxidoreductase [Stellaceae bacterium]|nr:SDR family NAD(P)-dependent oxidoreductase [Stellaceae bacterium]
MSGWSCRLPGANSVAALWSLLIDGRCAISRVPDDRFPRRRFEHPRRQQRGKSYTWAAGILDDVWGFDPAVFGISPREAEQMDPQQRILLELTWEALEDAGIPPATISGSDIGVFVGGSSAEYMAASYGDPAVAGSHFATGNALSGLSNRISYVFDLHGPSVTIDTACSSSLVALHLAMEALRSGRISTAIVAGINVIASHASFVSFCQAGMLSPTGFCRAFDAKADGFVRAEGGVVFVLRTSALAASERNPIRGVLLGSEVNSDGRTNGISLPSLASQQELLRSVYARGEFDPNRLAFVEAHGTGTPVGDPIEARALGNGLGKLRRYPLPIGSLKTNIGHLEPASGIAGVLKAILALNHGILPPSLHFDEPNPSIDFSELNISVCGQPMVLARTASRFAGINSFGFGGTNAHVIAGPGEPTAPPANDGGRRKNLLILSAESKAALAALAKAYAVEIEKQTAAEVAVTTRAAAHRRHRFSRRLVCVASGRRELLNALEHHALEQESDAMISGTALGDDLPCAFVYAGNGSQWAGMGIAAYDASASFRSRFDEADEHFKEIAGWSLRKAMIDPALGDRLDITSIAQPLIFAIQIAATASLERLGLKPAAVLGHSVGEVAAACAAGILDLAAATKVIYLRSKHQEIVRGKGRMAAVAAGPETVRDLIAGIEALEIAAFNSPLATTIAGPAPSVAALKAVCTQRGIAFLDLGLEYPFHTAALESILAPLVADLAGLEPMPSAVSFISTVTGDVLAPSLVGAEHWARNVRDPVQFARALRCAAELGARIFVEIGPRQVFRRHIADSLSDVAGGTALLGVLDRSEQRGDPFDRAVAKAVVNGARVDAAAAFGTDPGGTVRLPSYPWQRQPYRYAPTVEATGTLEFAASPLAGHRNSRDALEWFIHVDTETIPEFGDHRVGDRTILPGTAFLEIALAVARQWLDVAEIAITDFEILKPLDLGSGQTQEVMSRVSPSTGTIEIFSRPRLGQAAWLLNCRGRMMRRKLRDGEAFPRPGGGSEIIGDSALYAIAEASGLNYGPAFRLVQTVSTGDTRSIRVTLAAEAAPSKFLLDPMRLDCCMQGVIGLFPLLRSAARGVAYVPVRVDEVRLLAACAVPREAIIAVSDFNERAIIADCTVFDAEGNAIALLRGVRSQAVPVRHVERLDTVAMCEVLKPVNGPAFHRATATRRSDDIIDAAKELGLIAATSDADIAALLFDGWATAAAYEAAGRLADHGVIRPDQAIARGAMHEDHRAWLIGLLRNLETAGLAKEGETGWSLIADRSLPTGADAIKMLVREQASRAAEILLASSVTGMIGAIGSCDATPPPRLDLPPSAINFFEATNSPAVEASHALLQIIAREIDRRPPNAALRILQIGSGPLVRELQLLGTARRPAIEVYEPDAKRLERLKTSLARSSHAFLGSSDKDLAVNGYDIVVSLDALHRLPAEMPLDRVQRLLAPGGVLIALEAEPTLFRDLIFGLDRDWFGGGHQDFPVGPLRMAEEWQSALESANFCSVRSAPLRCGPSRVALLACEAGARVASSRRGAGDAAPLGPETTVVVSGANSRHEEIGRRLTGALFSGRSRTSAASGSGKTSASGGIVIQLIAPEGGNPVDEICNRCLDMKRCAESIEPGSRLFLVFSGAHASGPTAVNPISRALWSFSRTLANEFSHLNVSRIDLADDLGCEDAAKSIRAIIASERSETELCCDGTGVTAIRVAALDQALGPRPAFDVEAATLERSSHSPQRLNWVSTTRRAPSAGEVEIEVAAVGVNFRDLMSVLSLLPDEFLEQGFAGPSLGLECSGRIVRVGSRGLGFRVGDRVVALASSAYASHVTVGAQQVSKIPPKISSDAAATLPVAFLTAYYSLVTVAKLKRGEWVLIHGGAGGVGFAAIQIARKRHAKIIASAGSLAKRNLLRQLGVRHVLDSRSNSFAEQVRHITGSGVDVVLNSLSGEAMEESIACLRAFGRFVELGKRDYVANTPIALRPFRRNIAYFGVDVDQLIAGKATVGRRIFDAVMAGVRKGDYKPLPHTIFEASQVSDAFQIMQQAAHIGKLVVRPHPIATVRAADPDFTLDPRGSHLVTGGLGGFGLETAKWLVDRGAKHLVLLGRRGAASAEAMAATNEFRRRGVDVLCDPCDVADADALAKVLEKMRANMPPLVGVIHAAMVLDDSTIANLDAERLQRVLRPKVLGAENLDLATRGDSLGYFVLFSSVVTLIGNPGQGGYVAANGYLEGLARRRRRLGLPALAIGWGPIADVGVVARDQKVKANLEKLGSARGMTGRAALDLMGQALGRSQGEMDFASMTIAIAGDLRAAGHLAALRSPTYAYLRQMAGSDDTLGQIDIHSLVSSPDIAAARRKVADIITTELAHVLSAQEAEINRDRVLGDLGLDSLMTLELGMKLESTFQIRGALAAIPANLTANTLAAQVIAHLQTLGGASQPSVVPLISKHAAAIGPEEAEFLDEIGTQTTALRHVS